MNTRTLRIGWNLLVVAAMGFYLAQTGKYSPDSALFPRLIGFPMLGLALLGLGVEVAGWISTRRRSSEATRVDWKNLALAVAMGIVYLILWSPLGFVLDTVVFMVWAPLALGYVRARAPLLLGLGIATAGLFAFLFHLGSGAILPRGFFNVGWF